jgi:hypothetical protein
MLVEASLEEGNGIGIDIKRCAGGPVRIPTWSKNCHFMIGELSKKAKPRRVGNPLFMRWCPSLIGKAGALRQHCATRRQ